MSQRPTMKTTIAPITFRPNASSIGCIWSHQPTTLAVSMRVSSAMPAT